MTDGPHDAGYPPRRAADKRSRTITALAPLALAAAFLVAFFVTLGDYGITWDEPENFYTGARHLQFLTSGDTRWLRVPGEQRFVSELTWSARDSALFARELDDFRRASARDLSPQREYRFARHQLPFLYAFSPFANTLSAVTDKILARWLGWLEPVPAHHASIGLVWAGFLMAVFRFARRLAGPVTAFVAAGSLAVTPRIWGPAHNNVKDLPETAIFGFALIAFYIGVTEDRPPWVLAAGALAGLAATTKLNGAVVFVVAAGWLLGSGRFSHVRRRTRIAVLCSPAVAAAAFFITWPYLWLDPVGRTGLALRHGLTVATSTPSVTAGYALLYVAITTPLVVLVLAGLGMPKVLRLTRISGRPGILLMLWAAIPIFRVSLPGTGFYDGIRQFTEYWPALAVIAGVGAGQLAERVHGYVQRHPRMRSASLSWLVSLAVVGVALVPQLVATVKLHPYEDVYFNALVGGPSGADRRDVHWATDYWGSSYLEWARWANEHMERRAEVVAPIAGFLLPYDGLRPDIMVHGALPHKPSLGPRYLVFVTRREFYGSLEQTCDPRRPMYQIQADGLPILKMYRLSVRDQLRRSCGEVGEVLSDGKGGRAGGSTAP